MNADSCRVRRPAGPTAGVMRVFVTVGEQLVGVDVKFFKARNFSALSTSTVAASLGQSLAQQGAGTLGGMWKGNLVPFWDNLLSRHFPRRD